MALTAAYATLAEYKASKGSLTTANDSAISRGLIAASRLVDQICGRLPGYFNKDEAATARTVVVPLTGDTLPLPYPLVSVTTVELDAWPSGVYAAALAAASYELWPLGAALSGEPAPYTAIRGIPWGVNGTWYENARVRITGIWGWPAVPSAVKEATIELCAILRVESPRATGRIQEGNAPPLMVSRAARDMVERILTPYMNYAGSLG